MLRHHAIGLVATLGLMSASADAATPQYVTSVYMCSEFTFNVNLSDGTILNVWLNDTAVMNQNLYDKLYAMFLELLASGRQVGGYDVVGHTTACGQNVI